MPLGSAAVISKSAVIYPWVKLGKDATVEDFVIIGAPFRNMSESEAETLIGDGAVIRSHTVIYAGNRIGKNFQTGNKANIREKNIIGDNVSIGTLSVVEFKVSIGSNVRIHSQAFIPEYTVLEDGCWIGPNVVLTNARYPNSPDAKKHIKGPRIERDAIIGANTTILPGITVGARALVGASSLITRDVPDQVVVYGHPATIRKTLDDLPYK
jgi:acetyltransferase-like isoleucine patch superfamily enzyme